MTAGYKELKVRAWRFTKKFDGRPGFGLGDARAYLSAVIDLFVAGQGLKYTEALSEALDYAEKLLEKSGKDGVVKDYYRVYEDWLRLDRSKLSTRLLDVEPVRQQPSGDSSGLTVVSLFTGAYGLDLGFELEGFEVTVALDISRDSYLNLKANRPKIPFLLGDIAQFKTSDILKEAGLRPGEVDVVTGGPPCQPFSPAGKRQSLRDPRAAPLMDFIRVIKEARPKVFVMEEVPGILSARIKHVPIRERGKRPLLPEEEPGSAWRVVLQELKKTGYRVAWRVLNAADYGTPQVR
ncbi:MAG: hypothetical protein DRN04_13770, partial [Thermoprotei archaeon]